MKSTPGPWTVRASQWNKEFIITSDSGRITEVRDTTGDAEANARLISKAPEMLAYIKKECSDCKALQGYDYQMGCDTCDTGKLIKEIEGE